MGNIQEDILKRLSGATLLSEEEGEATYADSGSPALNWVLSGSYTKGVPVGVVLEYFRRIFIC